MHVCMYLMKIDKVYPRKQGAKMKTPNTNPNRTDRQPRI